MSVTTLYKYLFSDGCIFELRFDDVSSSSPKENRYQWFLIYEDIRYILEFDYLTETERVFKFLGGVAVLNTSVLTLTLSSSFGEVTAFDLVNVTFGM